MADLVIKNGLVVTPMGIIKGGLAAMGGKITQIGSDESLPKDSPEVDARGNLVLPGVIDPHTHLHSIGDESLPFDKAIRSESVSAAVSGITTVVSTPFTPTKTPQQLPTLRKLRKAASDNSFIDFKFNTVIFFDSHLKEMPEMAKEGFNSFKFLMGYAREEAEAIGIVPLDWAFFYRAAEVIARIGTPAIQLIHCEEPEIGHMLIERLKATGRTDLASWEEARPAVIEGMHAFTAGLIAYYLGSPLYIVHITSEESLEAVDYLRAKGARVRTETCTHYLALTKYSPLGPMGKCSPPLRDEAHQKMLWKALANGTVEIVGSDQCMIARASKEKGIWQAAPGAGSMSSVFPVMMTDGVNKGRITIEQFVRICSENAARALGMYPQKGTLSPGSDADIIIVDPNREWTLTAETTKSALEYFNFEGYKAKGKVVKTFLRGELVAEEGELVAKATHGRYV
jgi:dihydroorotase-like cyclic amidohydrolase